MIIEENVKKPSLDDEQKANLGEKLSLISKRYPRRRDLEEANVEITLTVFIPTNKSKSKGYLEAVTGTVTCIDFQSNRFIVDERRFKIAEIIKVEIPSSFEAEEWFSDSGANDYMDSYADDTHLTSSQRREQERVLQELQEWQQAEYERQMRRDHEQQLRREQRTRNTGRRYGYAYESAYGSAYEDDIDENCDPPFVDYYDDPYSGSWENQDTGWECFNQSAENDLMGDFIPDIDSYFEPTVVAGKRKKKAR